MPHGLHDRIVIVDSGAAKRRHIEIGILCFGKAGIVVFGAPYPKSGINTLAPKPGPQPIGRKRPARRQVIKVKQHMGRKIARRRVTDDGNIKKLAAQLPLGRKNVTVENPGACRDVAIVKVFCVTQPLLPFWLFGATG